MGLLGDLLHWMAELAVQVLQETGYVGLLLLMAAESMVFPVPSEAVMPFAGYLVWTGEFSWFGAIAASTAGSLLGSALSYLMGRHGFSPLVRRYGKYVLVQPHHIDAAERFFWRRGTWAILLCRFLPGVRHVCSIPAGSARMPWGKFLLATGIGATAWNVILLSVGFALGPEYERIEEYKGVLDIIAVALALLVVGYLVYEWRKARANRLEAMAVGVDPEAPHEPPAPASSTVAGRPAGAQGAPPDDRSP